MEYNLEQGTLIIYSPSYVILSKDVYDILDVVGSTNIMKIAKL